MRECVYSGSNEIGSDRRSRKQFLKDVFLIAELKWAAVTDAEQAPLQQESSPAPAHSSRGKFLADSPLVPALVMFIETPKVRIKKWLLKL